MMLIKRLVIYCLGIVIGCFGIAFVIVSNIGTGAWDAIFVGANEKMNLSIGTWSIFGQIVVVISTAALLKKRIAFETIVPILLRGWSLDLGLFLLQHGQIQHDMVHQLIFFLIGLVMMGCGTGIYISAKFPNMPIDALMVGLREKYAWSLQKSRIILELSAVGVAFLLSGPIGVGTMIMAISMGYLVQKSNELTSKILNI